MAEGAHGHGLVQGARTGEEVHATREGSGLSVAGKGRMRGMLGEPGGGCACVSVRLPSSGTHACMNAHACARTTVRAPLPQPCSSRAAAAAAGALGAWRVLHRGRRHR